MTGNEAQMAVEIALTGGRLIIAIGELISDGIKAATAKGRAAVLAHLKQSLDSMAAARVECAAADGPLEEAIDRAREAAGDDEFDGKEGT